MDGQIYNLIYYLELDHRILIITFNCRGQELEDWKSIAKEMMDSITINS